MHRAARAVVLGVLVVLAAVSVKASRSNHTNNWAVLVGTSRFWYNYRHIANTLSIYRSVQRLGIPDSQIILMLADDMACNPRNLHPGTVFNDAGHTINIYGDTVEVDYRGYEVTAESLIRLLTGRVDENTPRSKRLLSDASSNVLLYMSGHGGEQFIKFQDSVELASPDLADAIQTMHERRRYNAMLVIVDSCQAATMADSLYSPNVIAVGSAIKGQNSLSHGSDAELGLPLIDSFTHTMMRVLETVNATSQASLADMRRALTPGRVRSDPGWRTDLFAGRLEDVLLTDFFGSVPRALPVPSLVEYEAALDCD